MQNTIIINGQAQWGEILVIQEFFPDAGRLHMLSTEVTLPMGDLKYWKVDFDHRYYFRLPFRKKWTLILKIKLDMVTATDPRKNYRFLGIFLPVVLELCVATVSHHLVQRIFLVAHLAEIYY